MNALTWLQALVVFPDANELIAFCSVLVRLVLVPPARFKLCTSVVRFDVCAEGPLTVTVKLPTEVLPAASFAEQLTVVVPIGNVLPEAGAHATVGDTPELSVAV